MDATGEKVLDIIQQELAILSENPQTKNIVIMVGGNDTVDQVLKQHFNMLKTCKRSVFIAGPVPTFRHGSG